MTIEPTAPLGAKQSLAWPQWCAWGLWSAFLLTFVLVVFNSLNTVAEPTPAVPRLLVVLFLWAIAAIAWSAYYSIQIKNTVVSNSEKIFSLGLLTTTTGISILLLAGIPISGWGFALGIALVFWIPILGILFSDVSRTQIQSICSCCDSPAVINEIEPSNSLLFEEEETEEFTQQLTRRTLEEPEGKGEVIEGMLKVEFPEQSILEMVHIPISPSLPSKPKVEFELLSGDDVRIKLGDAYPYGVRLEMRRPESKAIQQTVEIAVFIIAEDK